MRSGLTASVVFAVASAAVAAIPPPPVIGCPSGTSMNLATSRCETHYAVTVNQPLNGVVTSSNGGISCGPGQTRCSMNVHAGTFAFNATPVGSYKLGPWGDACTGQPDSTCTIYINSARTISKTFPLPPPPPSANGKSVMPVNQILKTNESLWSDDKAFQAILHGDGNLCVWAQRQGITPNPIWCSHAVSTGSVFYAIMQTDGNFCVYPGQYGEGRPGLWCTQKVAGGGQFFAVLNGSGNLVVNSGVAPVSTGVLWQHGNVYSTVAVTQPATGGAIQWPDQKACPPECSRMLKVGSAVQLTAVPPAGHSFAGWDGACQGPANPCALTVAAGGQQSATFQSCGAGQLVLDGTRCVSLSPWRPYDFAASTVVISIPEVAVFPSGGWDYTGRIPWGKWLGVQSDNMTIDVTDETLTSRNLFKVTPVYFKSYYGNREQAFTLTSNSGQLLRPAPFLIEPWLANADAATVGVIRVKNNVTYSTSISVAFGTTNVMAFRSFLTGIGTATEANALNGNYDTRNEPCYQAQTDDRVRVRLQSKIVGWCTVFDVFNVN